MEATFTFLLNRAQSGDRAAESRVFRLIQGRLRRIAAALMKRERRGHTLQATALVNEAFLKKLSRVKLEIRDREHFYSIAAGAMRQVLIEHARLRGREKRMAPDTIAEGLMRPTALAPEVRISVERAFDELGQLDLMTAQSLRLRFVEGQTVQETAASLGRPVWKVRADCDFGLKWMAAQLGPQPE